MRREQACRRCKRLTFGPRCPVDGSTSLSRDWSGLIVILDADRSEVARTIGAKTAGRYAHLVR
jgi:DNA-directed RNA polymerase subunit E"